MIKFAQATSRNTQCYSLSIGNVDLTISYETVIAASLPGVGRIRKANIWGPTTGRHFADTHTRDNRVVGDDEFDQMVSSAISQDALGRLTQRLSA